MTTNEAKDDNNIALHGVKSADVPVDINTPVTQVFSLQRVVSEAGIERIDTEQCKPILELVLYFFVQLGVLFVEAAGSLDIHDKLSR